MKNILRLDNTDAKEFLLKEESYFNFDLPKYFKFSELLSDISKKLNTSNLSNYCSRKPESLEGVNYKILNNKDGEYAWRLCQLIHPVLYVELVHKMTEEENWQLIREKFEEFQGGVVDCVSLPVIKSEKQKTDKAEQIFRWWENVEQKSISLALEYEYIFYADIVDCYGSIYTHSIPWALHTKKTAKRNKRSKNLLGNFIDISLRSMANGQTNGIPQGSILMDFIAEMVLGYIDQELTKKLKKQDVYKTLRYRNDYRILRYRDDYRVFVNNPQMGKEIIKELTDVLSEMGMRLNTEKTRSSNDVIHSSIKADKLFWLTNGRIRRNFEKQLLIIYDLSKKHPNSGTLAKELHNFYRRIAKPKKINQNLEVLVSILVNIAFKNPRTYPIISAILSKILSLLENKKEKEIIINKIQKRFQRLPNTEHLDLWLQRITLKIEDSFSYRGKLCEKVKDNSVKIWNSVWLNDDFNKIISSAEIIDREEIKNMQPVISDAEVSLFEQKNYYY